MIRVLPTNGLDHSTIPTPLFISCTHSTPPRRLFKLNTKVGLFGELRCVPVCSEASTIPDLHGGRLDRPQGTLKSVAATKL